MSVLWCSMSMLRVMSPVSNLFGITLLEGWLLMRIRMCVCVCVWEGGDFNAVCSVSERRSVGSIVRQSGMAGLNQFIDDNLLVDLPLRRRSYTRYRGDGKSESH